MNDRTSKKEINEILKQKLENSHKIDEKAMILRQPSSTLSNQNTTTNTENDNQNQYGRSENNSNKK
jgi:hypothetical protein